MDSKGQSGTEAIIAIIILLVLFIIVNFLVMARNNDTILMGEVMENGNFCNKVAGIISNLYANELKGEITIVADRDFEVNSGEIIVGNAFCDFVGEANDAALTAGSVRIYNETGVVNLENV